MKPSRPGPGQPDGMKESGVARRSVPGSHFRVRRHLARMNEHGPSARCGRDAHTPGTTRFKRDFHGKLAKAAGFAFCLLCIPAIQGCAGMVATGTAVGGVAAAQDRRTPGNYVDDEIIELKVFVAIRQHALIANQTHVNATSFNGLVLLTGEMPGDSLRKRITEIVRNIPGVRAVQNETALMAPSTLAARASDALVTAKVKLALLQNTRINAAQIKVVTERGNVYLMGLLRQEEADRATETARRVAGVQRVVKVVEYIE